MVRRTRWGRVHQNFFRDYDPAIGRYVESDPIGLNGGASTYGYALANPTSLLDTMGLSVVAIFDRPSGALTVTDVDTHESITVSAYSGIFGCRNNKACDATVDTGPLPTGDWLIGNGFDSGHGGDDWWYRLYGPNGRGGFSYTAIPVKDPTTGQLVFRGGFNLHTGLISLGCLTVPSDVPNTDPGYPRSSKFSALKSLLERTKPLVYKGTSFRGTLNVR